MMLEAWQFRWVVAHLWPPASDLYHIGVRNMYPASTIGEDWTTVELPITTRLVQGEVEKASDSEDL
jgi:hypothetical protein